MSKEGEVGLIVQYTTSQIEDFPTQEFGRIPKYFPYNMKISTLKEKLQLIVGTEPKHMSLTLINSATSQRTPLEYINHKNELNNEVFEPTLQEFLPENNFILLVTDNDPACVIPSIYTSNEKYEMSKEEYEKREGTFLSWKKQHKPASPAGKYQTYPENFKVTQRCRVLAAAVNNNLNNDNKNNDLGTATIRYIGQLPEFTGFWVGVEFDEEGNGKSNGTIKGVSLFDCPKSKGLFVRPDRICELGAKESLDDIDEI